MTHDPKEMLTLSASSRYWLSIRDNWLIRSDGLGERLHKTPRDIFSV